jgi:hypothetical protein
MEEPLEGRKYDCETCGATVDCKYLQTHIAWHEWLDELANR